MGPASVVASFALRSVGRDVAPGLVGVGIAAAVMFSPSGLDPRDVVRWLDASVAARLALFGAAILFCGSSARAALVPPGHVLLRSSPVPRALVLGHAVVVLGTAALPLALVVGAGGGLLRGVSTMCAIGALAVARFVGAEVRGLAGLVLGAVALATQAEAPELGAASAAASFTICVPIAHRRAPELSGFALSLSPRTPLAALVSAYVLATVREEPARLTRASIFAGLGVVVAASVEARNPSVDALDAMRTAGTCLALPVAAAFATLAPALARTRRSLGPLVRASGAAGAVEIGSFVAGPAAFAVVIAAALAVAAPGLGPSARASVAAFAAELTFAIGVGVLWLERRALRLAARRDDHGVRLGVEWLLFGAAALALSNVTATGAVISSATVAAAGARALAREAS